MRRNEGVGDRVCHQKVTTVNITLFFFFLLIWTVLEKNDWNYRFYARESFAVGPKITCFSPDR